MTVKLNKEEILKLTPDAGRRQQSFSLDDPTGLKVRVGRSRGKLSHTYFIERRIDGRIQKKTLNAVQSYRTTKEVKREFEQTIGAWSQGKNLSNTEKSKHDRTTGIYKVTFGNLIETYLKWMEHTGKKSSKSVKSIVKKHIRGDNRTNPIWTTRISAIQDTDIRDFIASVKQKASPHIADQVRQIIKAAYNKASDSFSDVDIELEKEWQALGIRTPIKVQKKRIKGSDTVKDNAFTETQLKALIRSVEHLGLANQAYTPLPTAKTPYKGAITFHRDAYILFHIYTGGQRTTQLAELTASSIIEEDGKKYLHAFKHQKKTGYSEEKKPHLIPITPWIAECIEKMGTPTEGKELRELKKLEATNSAFKHYVWNLIEGNNNQKPDVTTLPKLYRKWLQPLMDQAEVLEPSDSIQPNWIRKSVETLMRQRFDTRPDHLGWLQDHGVGGVQNKHYNKYAYLKEKSEVLTRWYTLCQGQRDE